MAANRVSNGLPWPCDAGPASCQAGEVGVGPFPPSPCTSAGGGCFLSLASGCLAGRGWFSIAWTAALSKAAGCQRLLSAGDADGEPVEMPKREFRSRAVCWLLGPIEVLGRG